MRSTEHNLAATTLSWMAKCPLAKNIVLTSGCAISYATPFTLEELRNKHDAFAKEVNNYVGRLLETSFNLVKLNPQKLCLSFNFNSSEKYIVCGQPDLVYFIYRKKFKTSPFILVSEVTLSPSIRHMARGELLFYMMAYYMHYGVPAVGLVVGKKSVEYILPKLKMYRQLKKLFTKKNYKYVIREIEKRRRKKPWMCSLCDLKHLCPLGGEV